MRLALALMAAGVLAVPAADASGVARIAFNGGFDVVTVAPDGTDLQNLTPGEQAIYTSDLDPSWSPDGSRIAFVSHRDSTVSSEIYVMNADGGDQRRLTTDSGQNQILNVDPAWSPRGGLIAFEKSINSQSYDIWVMQPDGSGQRRVTADGGPKGPIRWSPGGTRLLYTRNETPGSRIWVVSLDGSPPRPLSSAGAFDFGPAWSPDGTKIALSAPALVVMNADGSDRRQLTQIGVESPSWSPDGTAIAFGGFRTYPQYASRFGVPSREDVFVIRADGLGLRRLTGPFDEDIGGAPGGSQPTWWPDGSRLFFTGRLPITGPLTTFVMNADGTCEGRFAPDGPALQRPVWRPGALPSLPPIGCAELRLSGNVLRVDFALGEVGQYRVRIDNDGSLAAAGIRLRVEAGAETTFTSEQPGCAPDGSALQCAVDLTAAGGTRQLAFDASRQTAGPIVLKLHVSAAEPDTDPTNNDLQLVGIVLPCTIVGSAGSDVIYGTPKADRICALPGADRIFAGAGNDFIDAGNGADRIYPGPGRDTVIAKGGEDVVYARDGERDWIDCGSEQDIAIVDRIDVVRHCEYVLRPPR